MFCECKINHEEILNIRNTFRHGRMRAKVTSHSDTDLE